MAILARKQVAGSLCHFFNAHKNSHSRAYTKLSNNHLIHLTLYSFGLFKTYHIFHSNMKLKLGLWIENMGNRNRSPVGYKKTFAGCVQGWQRLRNSCGPICSEQSDQGRGRINTIVYI